ncbi:MAG: hypothetical protein Kow00107_05420 [Planctomycetota bacterium]
MTLRQAIGVLLGADIGTTVTVQLVAFDLFKWSPIALFAGWLLSSFGNTGKARSAGRLVLGAGFLFFGMGLMATSMKPLGQVEWVREWLAYFSKSPILGILASAVFTALVRSSATTIILALGLAQAGVIGLAEAIPIILGANVGTCSTAMIAAIGSGRAGWRIASAHVLFKLGGVILMLPFIGLFAELVDWVGSAMGANEGRQVANAHTLFNLLVAVVFFPFVGIAERLLLRLMPDRPRGEGLLRWINRGRDVDPEPALMAARQELQELVKDLVKTLRDSERSITELDEHAAERVRKADERFKAVLAEVSAFITDIRKKQLTALEREECAVLNQASRSIHHAYSIVSATLLDIRGQLAVAPAGLPMESVVGIRKYFALIREIADSTRAVLGGEGRYVSKAAELEALLNEELKLQERRLRRNVPGSEETSFLFSEILLHLYSLGRELDGLSQIIAGEPREGAVR